MLYGQEGEAKACVGTAARFPLVHAASFWRNRYPLGCFAARHHSIRLLLPMCSNLR